VSGGRTVDALQFDESYWTERSAYRKYDGYADAMNSLRGWYAGMWRMLDRHLPAPGRHVDAGCGHGTIVHDLLDRGWDAHGFDLSEWVIAEARAYAGADGERFAVGSLDAIPFAGTFDLVTCFEVLEHVPDPVAALRALGARLRPGGRLVATTPNLRPLMPWPDPLTSDPTHISVHSARWWRQAVEAAGLRSCAVSTFISVPLLWRAHPLLSRWIGLGPAIGPGTLIVADAPQRGSGSGSGCGSGSASGSASASPSASVERGTSSE
jgi:SAM-dependent methyltransferase